MRPQTASGQPLAAALALVWISAFTQSAGAASERCLKYSQDAVSRYNVSVHLGCGFSSARWQSNPKNHYEWCLQAPEARLRSEERARRLALGQCAKATAPARRKKRQARPAARPETRQQASERLAEIEFWKTIKDNDNPTSFLAYLKRYPHGVFSELARIRLNELDVSVEAAEQDYSEAQNKQSVMYQYGFGVEQDLEETAKWYREGTAQGNQEARAQKSSHAGEETRKKTGAETRPFSEFFSEYFRKRLKKKRISPGPESKSH